MNHLMPTNPFKRGFTLLETLILLAVIVTLAAIAAPKFIQKTENQFIHANNKAEKKLRKALKTYYEQYRRYPKTLKDVEFVVLFEEYELPALKEAAWVYNPKTGLVEAQQIKKEK